MEPQTPAAGIAATLDWPGIKEYTIECACGDPAHSHRLRVESDAIGVIVKIDTQTKTDVWSELITKRYDIDNIVKKSYQLWIAVINSLYRKIKLTWSIWTAGYVETTASIILTKQQATNYGHALLTAVDDVDHHLHQP